MQQVRCTICGKLADREHCTPLTGLAGTPNGWECPECDQAAEEAGKNKLDTQIGYVTPDRSNDDA